MQKQSRYQKKSKERYKNLSQEEKYKIKEYQRQKYQELVQYKKDALKDNYIFVPCLVQNVGEITIEFDNIRVNEKEFHKPKQPINLMWVNVDQIVASDKCKHCDEGYKYFMR